MSEVKNPEDSSLKKEKISWRQLIKMDGYFYNCDNFEFFRDMMKIKHASHPCTKGNLCSENIDFYNLLNSSVVITNNPYKGVLIIPNGNEPIEDTKLYLENLTRIKLTRAKSNGN